MVNEENTQWIIRNLWFRNYDFILPQNHLGGIWLLWKEDNVDLPIIAKQYRAIHCSVIEKGTNKYRIVKTIYASAQNHIRCNVQGVKKNFMFVIAGKHLQFLSSFLQKNHFHDTEPHFRSSNCNLMTFLYLLDRKTMYVSGREFNYSIPKIKLMLDSLYQDANCQKHPFVSVF